uniref:Uncharacterized protein n=1 Tax=Morchella importuna TaxID=1174673 RepID=A0A650AFB0_9PEZI|nr:hypothetical protein [Morchella importuna]QGN66677.1 hypothetical protein [Morchella importuna]
MSPSVPLPPLPCTLHAQLRYPPPTTALIPRGRNMLVGSWNKQVGEESPFLYLSLIRGRLYADVYLSSPGPCPALTFSFTFWPPPPRLGIAYQGPSVTRRGTYIQGGHTRNRSTVQVYLSLQADPRDKAKGYTGFVPRIFANIAEQALPLPWLGLASLIPFLRSGFLYSFLDPIPTIQALPAPSNYDQGCV